MAKKFPTEKYASFSQKIEEIAEKEEALKRERKKLRKKMIKLLLSCVDNWEPVYNEQAICLMPEQGVAWHVWFVEKKDNYYRFKEIPANLYGIENYYGLHKDSEVFDEQDTCIIPESLYEEIIKNKEIDFYLYEDKHIGAANRLSTKPMR